MRRRAWIQTGVLLAGLVSGAGAESRGKLHLAVYGSGFVVDTQRTIAYGKGVRRMDVKTRAQGAAEGDILGQHVDIDRVDSGVRLRLDPKTKTYTAGGFLAAGSGADEDLPPSGIAPTLRISQLTPTVSGPLGSDKINGFPSQSYTVRVVVDFTDTTTGKVMGTETLLEKLWVTEKAPAVERFRGDEAAFQDAVFAKYGAEQANIRWLIRQFNKQLMSYSGSKEDFAKLVNAYRSARAEIPGVTVRQLVAWTWQPKQENAFGTSLDIPRFVASLAAGLGAPPDAAGKEPLAVSMRPYWATQMEQDFGRSGSMVVMLGEVLEASAGPISEKQFEIPASYRKLKED